MTTESKPREFWLLKDADGVKNADYLTHEPTRHTISDFINVIEKSAYDELADREEKMVKRAAELRKERNQLQSELATLRQIKSSLSDVMDQKDKQIEALKAREIAHLALIQDLQKGIKAKDELLRECEDFFFRFDKAFDGTWEEVNKIYNKLREGKNKS